MSQCHTEALPAYRSPAWQLPRTAPAPWGSGVMHLQLCMCCYKAAHDVMACGVSNCSWHQQVRMQHVLLWERVVPLVPRLLQQEDPMPWWQLVPMGWHADCAGGSWHQQVGMRRAAGGGTRPLTKSTASLLQPSNCSCNAATQAASRAASTPLSLCIRFMTAVCRLAHRPSFAVVR